MDICFTGYVKLLFYAFVIHKVGFPWIMQAKNPCLIGGGSCNFQPSFRGGSVSFGPEGGEGHVFFIHHIPKCSDPAHPILFDRSLRK